ncbi:MAG: acetyl-CoA decarbonylase/synthase complex subunit delta [Endomicrobia bacterium]|nr:acetyl-CoA decarbonylase/synthase complex subunit delta [Endomicrobiia bacterium]MCX7941055.1 acetyl-CoA decarbonylase/synthase complex subunit delta [Endomicrobiia bacterium]MDW8055357.1 acetyl-CoA decarbonylase/synthase complex subunit delta [Elusimicrobiota bacterium]
MVEYLLEKWPSEISTVIIGATQAEGGTRSKSLKIGGQRTLPFLEFEGQIPNKPVIAAEVLDYLPEELWPIFYENLKDIITDPLKWIQEIEKSGPDAICLRLLSCHPDIKNNSKDYLSTFIPEVLKITKLPLIILGCDHIEKDTEILPFVSELTKNEKVLIGMAVKENYKTISLSAFACGHSVIAQTPLDINLAKQLNILINDTGIPLDRIVMHHTTGGLGYGFEYCYSIMERCRLAGLQGDKVMATPIINLIAEETWKTKEAKVSVEEEPTWGDSPIERGIVWETTTAMGYLQAGADILVLAHPGSIRNLKNML